MDHSHQILDEWRFITLESGEQFTIATGTYMMQQLSADSLDIPQHHSRDMNYSALLLFQIGLQTSGVTEMNHL